MLDAPAAEAVWGDGVGVICLPGVLWTGVAPWDSVHGVDALGWTEEEWLPETPAAEAGMEDGVFEKVFDVLIGMGLVAMPEPLTTGATDTGLPVGVVPCSVQVVSMLDCAEGLTTGADLLTAATPDEEPAP